MVFYTREQDLAAYDRLPERMRKLLRESRVNLAAAVVEDLLRQYPEPEVIEYLRTAA